MSPPGVLVGVRGLVARPSIPTPHTKAVTEPAAISTSRRRDERSEVSMPSRCTHPPQTPARRS